MWRQMGELMVRTQAHNDARFDRLDADVAGLKLDVAGLKLDVAGLKSDVAGLKTDVAGLKTDVAELKADVAELKADVAELKTDVAELKTGVAHLVTFSVETREQLNRAELAHARFEARVEAQFEELIALIRRDETGRSPRAGSDPAPMAAVGAD